MNESRKIVRICGTASYDPGEYAQEKEYGLSYAEFVRRKIYSAKYQVIVSLIDKVFCYRCARRRFGSTYKISARTEPTVIKKVKAHAARHA